MEKLYILLILLLFPLTVSAYTSPGAPTGYVNDYASVLSATGKNELEALLTDYQQQTGNEIAVAIIPSLQDETIETYAVQLFEEWGVGGKGQDTGALFVVALEDRLMRIEVGYGLEGDLTDVEAKQIVSNVVPPYFRNNDYDEGVRAAVVVIMQNIGAEYTPSAGVARSTRNQDSGGSIFEEFFWVFFFVFIWMGSVLSRSRSWWAGGVIGGVIGIIVGLFSGGWVWLPLLIVAGLVFDYLVSTKYKKFFAEGHHNSSAWPWLFLLGGRPGRPWDKRGGGGFGGFGGGLSGGGGASGNW